MLKSRLVQISVGGVITVFLGAVGSGLWQLVLSPLVHKTTDFTLSVVSLWFHGYVDLIYRGVSKNPSDYLALLPYMLICTAFILLPWIGLFSSILGLKRISKDIQNPEKEHHNEITRDELLKKVKRYKSITLLILLPMAIITSFIYLQDFTQTVHSRNAAIFIDRSIEIVSPLIDERTRLELRAEFRAIESAKDFYNLEDKLRKIAQDHAIKLPEFYSIRLSKDKARKD